MNDNNFSNHEEGGEGELNYQLALLDLINKIALPRAKKERKGLLGVDIGKVCEYYARRGVIKDEEKGG